MSTYPASHPTPGLSLPPTCIRVLLGLGLIVAGLVVLGDIAFATIVSTIFIGATAMAAGVFEIGHAFWTKGWGGFAWQILLGALYVAFGLVLLTQPVIGAFILTYTLGLVLAVSGVVRVLIGIRHWRDTGWLMLLSGMFGIVAGLIILTGFPASGVWVLGLLLGIDLLSHGAGWLVYAWLPAARTA
jgi:uncharacterized membrane protein HdeD (DUF308 family)